ncbi:unnamed protein product [Aphanomyces euteiches]
MPEMSTVGPCSAFTSDVFVASYKRQRDLCSKDLGIHGNGPLLSDPSRFCTKPSCTKLSQLALDILDECKPHTTNIVPTQYCEPNCQTALKIMQSFRAECVTANKCRACTSYVANTDDFVKICGLWDPPEVLRAEDVIASQVASCLNRANETTMEIIKDGDMSIMYTIGGMILGLAILLISLTCFKRTSRSTQVYRAVQTEDDDEELEKDN